MRALFGETTSGQLGGLPSIAPGLTPPGINTPTGQPSDPFAAMLAQMSGQLPGVGPSSTAFGGSPSSIGGLGMNVAAVVPRPRSTFMKLAPLLHAISVLSLVAFFVFRFEPNAYFGIPQPTWDRWAGLAKGEGNVAFVPIFYAFTTLQLLLHSIRIYYEPPPVAPSGILGVVVTHLPPPFPQLIHTARKYVAMGSAVLDDICVLLFGIGVVVWAAKLAAPHPGGVV